LTLIGRLTCSEATGWEFIEIYTGRHEGPFQPAALEVETGAFFTLEKIRAWAAAAPGDFSPVFLQVLPLLKS
jgi:hypothetical protein